MVHHIPILNGCDGNGQCHAGCGYRRTAKRHKDDPKRAQRMTAEALVNERKPSLPMPLLPCIHLGSERRDGEGRAEIVECEPCKVKNGIYKFKTFDCAVYGRCTKDAPVAGTACCVGCKDYDSNALIVNQGAGGLGDALMGSCAIVGLAKLHADRQILYKTGPNSQGFLSLFDLGKNVHIGSHDWDNGNERPAGDPHPDDLQMNAGHAYELQTKGKYTRLQRYCRNVGGVIPKLPKLKARELLRAIGKDFSGSILLSPFSTWHTREYPMQSWLTLERLLSEVGYRVVILDAPDANFPDRHKPLKSEIVLGAPAARVAGIILSSALLIGNDSGLSHLSGIMGVPTLVLTGQVTGPEVYGFYGPHVEFLDGHLDCKGCWWQSPFNASCQPTCPDLASITPAEIVQAVARIAGPPA